MDFLIKPVDDYANKSVLVAGGGGFIGGWFVKKLIDLGAEKIRVVDVKNFEDWYQVHDGVENRVLDLKSNEACKLATYETDYVFNLAADMGGMGFIENNKALCMLSVLINTNLLLNSVENKVNKYFYASSACIYPLNLQQKTKSEFLKECDAYPADPEDGYGWEKLFGERMCRHFTEDLKLETRVARFHNVYGPLGTYEGGREKAPAAICRKVAEAKIFGTNEIEIWGDGEQTRSFMYIDDCTEGIIRIFDSGIDYPINLGSEESVSINRLVDIVEEIAGIKLKRNYILDAPQGVRGRNSDNSLIRKELNWEPSIELRIGLEKTFSWIFDRVSSQKY
jgi:GDP-D-mannose 3',5'-epimerase